MLDERGAVAVLKEAWRRGGYKFLMSNRILSVRGAGWGFQGAMENIPAKVLGLITEHFGSFPQDGDCYFLRKGEAEQSLMLDQEAKWWDTIRDILDEEDKAEVQQTPIVLYGDEVWQEQRGLSCCMVPPSLSGIIDSEFRQIGKVAMASKTVLLWHSMAGTIAYVAGAVHEEYKPQIERLNGFPWCGEGGG